MIGGLVDEFEAPMRKPGTARSARARTVEVGGEEGREAEWSPEGEPEAV